MQLKKLALPILLGASLLATQVSYGLSFSDVKSSDWYAATVNKLVDKGGVKGYADGTFKPNGTITKAEFVTMTVRSMGYETETVSGHWSAGAFQKAREVGLLKGNEVNSSVDSAITRYDMALIASRALDVKKESVPSDYKSYGDALSDYKTAPSTYKDFIVRAYATGIIGGYPDRTFGGSKTLTRAEASAVVMRIIDSSSRVAVVKPSGEGEILSGETKSVNEMFPGDKNLWYLKSSGMKYETVTMLQTCPYKVSLKDAEDFIFIMVDGVSGGNLIAIQGGELTCSNAGYPNSAGATTAFAIRDKRDGQYYDQFEKADYWGIARSREKDFKIFPNPLKK